MYITNKLVINAASSVAMEAANNSKNSAWEVESLSKHGKRNPKGLKCYIVIALLCFNFAMESVKAQQRVIIPNIVHFMQDDSRWSGHAYAGRSCGTIAKKGALACVSMLLSAQGTTANQRTLNTWSQENSGYSGWNVWYGMLECGGNIIL